MNRAPKTRSHWTPGRDEALRELTNQYQSADVCAELLGCTTTAIRVRRTNINAHFPPGDFLEIALRRRSILRKSGCVEWVGSTDTKGYGQIRLANKKLTYVTRLVLARSLGRELRSDECACHHCDNPACVRADHLFAGTRSDNARDCLAKGRARGLIGPNNRPRAARGAEVGVAKLNDAKVREMRTLHASGIGHKRIAKMFGVSNGTARAALRGKTWRHVA